MKKVKVIIILIIILLIILAGILIIRLNQEKKAKEYAENLDDNITLEVEEKIIPVRGYEEFFSIEKMMSNYYLYLRMGNEEAVYNILTEHYKTAKRVTNSNAITIAKVDSGEGTTFRAREIYYKDDITSPIYLVYGIIEPDNHQGKECYAIVYVDGETATFAIEPISKTAYENYKTEKNELAPIKLEQKKFNKYTQVKATEEEIITRYFDTWIRENTYYPNYAYTKLDAEYQKAKYPNASSYGQYVARMQTEFASMLPEAIKDISEFASEEEYLNYINQYQKKGMKQYRVDERKEYTQYTFIDDYENYYIIRAVSPMNYTVLLDTYTVDIPEFIEQYNKADTAGKMQLNLTKIFSAINDGDYRYAYQKLNASYRNSNFPTQASFEEYIKTNFFTKNLIGVSDFQTYDYVYRYQVNIKNANQPNATYSVTKTFSMTLGEGTEVEYSFNK